MKNTKKIISIVLALVILFLTNIVSFAEDTQSEAVTEPSTSGTETPGSDVEKSKIHILLIYDEEKNEQLTILDDEINNKLVNELTGEEIKDYLNSNEKYKILPTYEKKTIGMHIKIEYEWTLQKNSDEGTIGGNNENILAETAKLNDDTENQNTSEEPLLPENPNENKYKYIFVISVLEKNEEESCTFNENITYPTCTEDGYTTYVCLYCEDKYTGNEVKSNGHKPAEVVEENVVDVTCGKAGSYDSVVYCSVCEKEILRETKTISATGKHTWDEGVITNEPTEESEGEKTFICTVCGETKTESIAELAHSHVAADVVVENEIEATCTTEGSYDEVVYCSKCNEEVSRTHKTVPVTSKHTWSNGECSVCHTPDEYEKKCISVLCKTVYFVGESWNSDVNLTLKFKNSTKKVTVKEENVRKSLKGFSTKKENDNMKCTFTYIYANSTITVQLPTIKCLSPQVVFEKTEGNDSINLFDNFSKGMIATRKIYLRSGAKWTYQILLADSKIELSPEANKVCNITLTSKKQNWKGHPAEKTIKNLSVENNNEINAEGVLEIKPIKFFNDSKKASDYYVTISGEANGKTYKFKIYLYGVTSVKPTTKSNTVILGSSSKYTVNFKENYVDSTYVNHSKKLTLSANAVGKTYISAKINGKTVKYYYYVKCKAPTVKLSSAKKTVNVSWKTVKGATGYKIYRSTSKNKGYKCVKTIKNGKTTKFTDTKLKSKKTYYYKVVAIYSKESKCNSNYSSIKSCKTK